MMNIIIHVFSRSLTICIMIERMSFVKNGLLELSFWFFSVFFVFSEVGFSSLAHIQRKEEGVCADRLLLTMSKRRVFNGYCTDDPPPLKLQNLK
jgi:hypothetical protein